MAAPPIIFDRIRDLSDFKGALTGGYVLTYDGADGKFFLAAASAHAHAIADVTGLQSALDSKASAVALDGKVSKPVYFDDGNLAAYNSLGALVDSGYSSGDFAPFDHTHAGVYSAVGHGHASGEITGLGTMAAQAASAVAITGGAAVLSGLTINTADGNVKIGDFLSGAEGTTDKGAVLLATDKAYKMGLISEADGRILSLALNVPQVGTKSALASGAIFRLDNRGGVEPYFSVLRYDASATTVMQFTADFKISPAGAATFGGSVTAATFVGNGSVPSGGASGYVLKKSSAASYDYAWAAESGGGVVGPDLVLGDDASVPGSLAIGDGGSGGGYFTTFNFYSIVTSFGGSAFAIDGGNGVDLKYGGATVLEVRSGLVTSLGGLKVDKAASGAVSDLGSALSGTVVVDPTLANFFKGTQAGNVTLLNPSGTVDDAHAITFRLKQDATGGRTIALDAKYRLPDGVTLSASTTAGKTNCFSAVYNAADDKWDLTGSATVFS